MQTLEGASKTKRGGEEGKPEFCWNEAFDPSQTLAGGSCSPTGKHTGYTPVAASASRMLRDVRRHKKQNKSANFSTRGLCSKGGVA